MMKTSGTKFLDSARNANRADVLRRVKGTKANPHEPRTALEENFAETRTNIKAGITQRVNGTGN
jgi:hypothetical protein